MADLSVTAAPAQTRGVPFAPVALRPGFRRMAPEMPTRSSSCLWTERRRRVRAVSNPGGGAAGNHGGQARHLEHAHELRQVAARPRPSGAVPGARPDPYRRYDIVHIRNLIGPVVLPEVRILQISAAREERA